jgi:hypothetical protein
VDSRKVEASSNVVVASMASLERGGASIEHPGGGCAEREVEVISEACAQGAFFEKMYQGVSDGVKVAKLQIRVKWGDRGTRLGLILYVLY